MFGLVLLLLIVVPVVELYVLFQVADNIGWGMSILVLLAVSFLGGALMKWQTAGAFGRVTDKIRQGQMPSNELVDGALMIFGGALLLTPGFFTDAFGLAMFIPPLRAVARKMVLKRVRGRVTTMHTSGGHAFMTFGGTGPGAGPGFGSVIDVDEVEDVIVTREDTHYSELPPNGSPGSETK